VNTCVKAADIAKLLRLITVSSRPCSIVLGRWLCEVRWGKSTTNVGPLSGSTIIPCRVWRCRHQTL